MMRSLLYVPADSPRFIGKAHERGADAIILDLEDSVAPEHISAARLGLGQSVASYEPSMNAWDCLGGYCLVAEAGGWHLPFPLHGNRLTQRGPVCAAGPGAKDELCALIGGFELPPLN